MKLRLGTRGSALATTQSRMVADSLVLAAAERGVELEVELVSITTHGDVARGSVAGLSEVGVFVNALRTAVLEGECDLVVHSLKDMPTAPHPELSLAAIPVREDARDALCARGATLAELPPRPTVGTGSPRRSAQVLALRPDAVVVPVRGNVDTRLALAADELDAVVLAIAGLNRLGRADEASHVFDPEDMLPAPGQGALAVEIGPDASDELAMLVGALDDADARAAVTAERAALAVLDAGCTAPMGAHATVTDGVLALHARVLRPDGLLVLNETARGRPEDAASIGRQLGHALLGRGAAMLMGRA